MGLRIISTTSASIGPAASPISAELAEGLPGEFASLLSGQTLATLVSPSGINNPGGSGPKDPLLKDAPNEPSENAGNLASPMDPAALVAMLGNPHLQPAAAPRAHGLTEQPDEKSHADASRASGVRLADLTETGTLETASKSPSAQEVTPASLLARGNERPITGVLPEEAANIAAERSEKTSEASSYPAGLTVAAQHRGIPHADQTTTLKPTHTEIWPQQFSEKIVWMAKNDQQTAQINITPPQLGPVQITLNLSGDNASALFTSPHPEVRQIIENSLPQLREMLASTGISLGEASVGANLAQQNQNNPFLMANRNQSTGENAILPANDTVPLTSSGQVPKAGRGLVDLFA